MQASANSPAPTASVSKPQQSKPAKVKETLPANVFDARRAFPIPMPNPPTQPVPMMQPVQHGAQTPMTFNTTANPNVWEELKKGSKILQSNDKSLGEMIKIHGKSMTKLRAPEFSTIPTVPVLKPLQARPLNVIKKITPLVPKKPTDLQNQPAQPAATTQPMQNNMNPYAQMMSWDTVPVNIKFWRQIFLPG